MQQLTTTQRITSIDTLRGLIIVIMGLDHVRDFFSGTQFDPMNPAETTPVWSWTPLCYEIVKASLTLVCRKSE